LIVKADDELLGEPTPRSVAYAVCYIQSEQNQTNLVMKVGSDDQARVAEAVRSGKLEVDLPSGHAKFTLENRGFGGMYPVLTHAENGKLVFVTIPE
jgi:hypothetical protein